MTNEYGDISGFNDEVPQFQDLMLMRLRFFFFTFYMKADLIKFIENLTCDF